MHTQPILVAVEANQEGRHVMKVADRVARQFQQPLSLINVVKPLTQLYADLNFSPITERSVEWEQQQASANKQILEEMACGTSVGEISVELAQPSDEIVTKAEALDANLIVMGVHNRKGLDRLLGSTTHAVMNHCDRDILAVHPDSSDIPYRRVLVALDTSDLSNTVMSKARQLAADAEYKLLSVTIPLHTVFAMSETGHCTSASLTQLDEELNHEVTAKLQANADSHGFTESEIAIVRGDPREMIIQAAEEMQADLIVIGSNKRGTLNRLILGSTARAVLNWTPCDVLVCRQGHNCS
ncbi:MAG: universal stress protein [Pseudomonadota bacterium]